jgi:tetratricopeptide (TPR) repeat protein
MRIKKDVIVGLLMSLMFVGFITSCSTKKNTPMTRFYHSLTAHYNILYNGEVAFEKARDAQIDGHKDDYNNLLPMYIATNKSTAGMGKGNYATAIEKCEKAIKLHSIKRKPKVKPGEKRTPELKAYLNRKEFNPYLWRAWLMMGQSQFHRGEFIEAASTFNYMIRLYATQPDIASMAKTWLARCYVALDWPYDAEDVLRRMAKDSLAFRVQQSYDNSRAAWLIQTGEYEEAIPLLKRTISVQKGKVERARLNFLLGQLCREVGQREEAFAALKKVIRANPPYEMSLNARVMQSEMASKGQTRKMIRKLQRMASKGSNKDYVDQIHLAIGNIYMNIGDTLLATYAWEDGLRKSKGDGAKLALLLKLSDLYWQQEDYIDASRCYKECLAALEKEKSEYKTIEQRNQKLEGLAELLQEIELQDSLQVLAQLPAAEREAVAERLAKEYVKKQKELEKEKGESALERNTQQVAQQLQNEKPASSERTASSQGWYFSNPNTVAQGKTAFFRKWGKRKNADLWRWTDKSALGMEDLFQQGEDDLQIDGTTEDYEELEEALEEDDSLQNDPTHKLYYLSKIPITEEQMEASHQQLSDALFKAGVLEQERLGNFALARKTLLRFINDYPEHSNVGDAHYHLFLICGRLGLLEESLQFRQTVIEKYADGPYAQLLANPKYEMIARGGTHLEDSVYAETYSRYLKSDYEAVKENYAFSTDNYPDGAHRARFMFVYAMSLLYTSDQEGFLAVLKELTEKYSSEEIAKLASEIMKGINEGRLINSEQWDASGIWARKSAAETSDSTSTTRLLVDKLGDFAFVLAYPKGSLDENQLLFEVARYNFTSFTIRNFELEISDLGDVSMLAVRGFRSYDEVHAYVQKLYSDKHMATRLEGIRSLLILEENLKLLGTRYSFEDYRKFYEENFQPMEIPEELQIESETIIRGEDEVDETLPKKKDEDTEIEVETDEDDDFPFGF